VDRIRQKYEEYGYEGLFEQQHLKRYVHRVPLATPEKVLALYQQSDSDLNVRHFLHKLKQEHGIRLSYSWVRQALQGVGLVSVTKRHNTHGRSGA
jgi:hypothetical protein